MTDAYREWSQGVEWGDPAAGLVVMAAFVVALLVAVFFRKCLAWCFEFFGYRI